MSAPPYVLPPAVPFGTGQQYGKQCSTHNKQVAVPLNGTQNLATVTGSGAMTYLFFAMQSTDAQGKYATLINIYVDGETTPSVSVPLNMLVNSAHQPLMVMTKIFGSQSPTSNTQDFSGYIYIRAPFNSSLRVDLVNGSGAAITIWSIVQYTLGGSYNWGLYGKLRSQGLGTNATLASVAPYAEQTLFSYSGQPGLIHNLSWVMNCNQSGYAALEGLFQVYVDGEATASYQSSGSEDFFGGSFYFSTGTYAADTMGLVYFGGTAYATVAYRYFIDDPFTWNSSVRMTWTSGNHVASNVPTATATVLSNVLFYTPT